MKSRNHAFFVPITVLASVAFPHARSASLDSVPQCKALANTDFSCLVDAPTQVTASQYVEATGEVPAHCEVSGYVAPSVGFELRLPIAWNGKFIQVGSGGHAGTLDWIQWCPTQKGYACLVTDMGHKGTPVDGLWAYGNLQANGVIAQHMWRRLRARRSPQGTTSSHRKNRISWAA